MYYAFWKFSLWSWGNLGNEVVSPVGCQPVCVFPAGHPLSLPVREHGTSVCMNLSDVRQGDGTEGRPWTAAKAGAPRAQCLTKFLCQAVHLLVYNRLNLEDLKCEQSVWQLASCFKQQYVVCLCLHIHPGRDVTAFQAAYASPSLCHEGVSESANIVRVLWKLNEMVLALQPFLSTWTGVEVSAFAVALLRPCQEAISVVSVPHTNLVPLAIHFFSVCLKMMSLKIQFLHENEMKGLIASIIKIVMRIPVHVDSQTF